MKKSVMRWLYWTPRILSILFIIFVSIFALDVFTAGYGFFQTILALVKHLMLTFLLILSLLIAWRLEVLGGILFILLGLFYTTQMVGKAPFLTFLVMAGPLFLIGILFILHKIFQKKGGEKKMAKKKKKAKKKTTKKKTTKKKTKKKKR